VLLLLTIFLCVTVKVYTNPYIFDTRVYEMYTYMYKQTKQLTLVYICLHYKNTELDFKQK
jgi:hypothetical protein